jgi:hypothetical protein
MVARIIRDLWITPRRQASLWITRSSLPGRVSDLACSSSTECHINLGRPVAGPPENIVRDKTRIPALNPAR